MRQIPLRNAPRLLLVHALPMPERPFRFDAVPGASRSLDARLHAAGYERDENASERSYRCAWRPQPLVLRWHRAWWPDGEHAYDARLEILEGDTVVAVVDVDELLRQKLSRPLRELIIEETVAIAARLSGRRRAPG